MSEKERLIEAIVEEVERECQKPVMARPPAMDVLRNVLRRRLSPPPEAQEVDRLRAENERIREALEWRPIETAPKDGTLIIVTNGAQRYPVRWWWPIGWSDNGRHDLLWTPTHWMPLPDPPSTPEPHDR